MASRAPVSASFCVPHQTQLVVKRESWLTKREFTIKDSNGILLFNMKSKSEWFTRSKKRIYDASSGKVLLSMKKDVPWFGSARWLAFHGDSESDSELRFTLKRKSSGSTSFEVFLPEDSDSASPDFSIKKNGLWSFTISSRGTPIAEAKKNGWPSSTYTVTVYPGVDRAFVAGLVLIWILESLEQQRRRSSVSGGGGGGGSTCGGGGGGCGGGG